MTAFIRHALALGFKEICFLDHLTITDSPNPMSMAVTEVPLYFQAVQHLKRNYSDRIAVKAGLEIEFNPQHTGLFIQIVNDFAFDVVGSSIHQLDGIDIVSAKRGHEAASPESEFIQRRYIETLERMLSYNYFDIICHLDLLKKFGENLHPQLEDRLTETLLKATDRNLAVEVNTSGYDHPASEPYPSPDILTRLCKAGVAITIGSDAHRPEEIGRHFGRALNMIQTAGFRHLSVFTGRRRRQVTIPPVPGSPQ